MSTPSVGWRDLNRPGGGSCAVSDDWTCGVSISVVRNTEGKTDVEEDSNETAASNWRVDHAGGFWAEVFSLGGFFLSIFGCVAFSDTLPVDVKSLLQSQLHPNWCRSPGSKQTLWLPEGPMLYGPPRSAALLHFLQFFANRLVSCYRSSPFIIVYIYTCVCVPACKSCMAIRICQVFEVDLEGSLPPVGTCGRGLRDEWDGLA